MSFSKKELEEIKVLSPSAYEEIMKLRNVKRKYCFSGTSMDVAHKLGEFQVKEVFIDGEWREFNCCCYEDSKDCSNKNDDIVHLGVVKNPRTRIDGVENTYFQDMEE